jgi:hypothetical protein
MHPSAINEKDAFSKLLDEKIYYFIDLKRLYQLQTTILNLCEGRPIKNDLVYEQVLFASLDGLIVRLHNFQESVVDFLNVLKNDHLDRFKRNNKRELAVNPADVFTDDFSKRGVDFQAANIFTRELQSQFDRNYDRLFPGVKISLDAFGF